MLLFLLHCLVFLFVSDQQKQTDQDS